MSGNPNILSGVRVLDLSRVMSGPFCTSMLADLGAEVIKIELPKYGDDARFFGPYLEDESSYFMLLNRNKQSVTVNMKSEKGIEIIKKLIVSCDVLVENFRPGVMARLGLDYETVERINEKIIYASISGFGATSPMKDLPAFDLVIQAMSGLMSLTGPRGRPTAVGESLADVCTGMFGAWSIAAALYNREKTNSGRHLDVSMLDSMLSMQLTGLSRQLYFDDTPEPVGNRHPVTYPVDSFEAKDGAFILVAFSENVFVKLTEAMGQLELATDKRFKNNALRNENEDTLRGIINDWAKGFSVKEVLEVLGKHDIPCAPIWNLKQAIESEHSQARNLIQEGLHEKFGKVPIVKQPVIFSGIGEQALPTIPTLGQHTEKTLTDILHLDADEIAQLKKNKTI